MNRSYTYIIILLALFFGFNVNAQEFTLATQAEVDAFDQSITDIAGTLLIHTPSGTLDPITDLNPLSNVTSMGGLTILGNDSLKQIDGLLNLTSIGYDLHISGNDILSQLDGLSNLTSIGALLRISRNPVLTQIDGLSNVTTMGTSLNIAWNDMLGNLDGLSNVTAVGYLNIENNDALIHLDGLSNLTSIASRLYIGYNDALNNIDGLSNVTSIGGLLQIRDNDALSHLDGLSNVTSSIPGNLSIEFNDGLTQIDGLSNITSVGLSLSIRSNEILSHIDGLSNVTSIGGFLQIRENNALSHLDGLSNVTSSIPGDLSIQLNDGLTQIDGLSNVTSVGGELTIANNDALSHISGLSELTSIGENLSIQFNHGLMNIDGLSNLGTIGGYLSIIGNSALSQVDGLSNVTSIMGPLSIQLNNVLTQLDGLTNLTSFVEGLAINNNAALSQVNGLSNITTIGVGGLFIKENNTLSQIDGLSNLTSIGGDLIIDTNDGLTQIDGLANVTSIEGDLGISYNINLYHLDGLAKLTSIEGDMYIDLNLELRQIDGLANLTSIAGFLSIQDNNTLSQINGLSNVTSILGELNISSNDALTDCCGIQYVLNTPGAIGGAINIRNNPSECSSPEEAMNASCSLPYIYNDIDANCSKENEFGIRNRRAIIEPINIVVNTDLTGRLDIDFLPIGNYKITVDSFGPWIANCPTSYEFEVTHPDTLPMIESFGLTATDPCPMASISLQMPFARPCFEHQRIYVEACNAMFATGPIEDGVVILTLDSILTFQAASISFDSIQPYEYRFDLGDLNPGNCARFWVDVMVSCDAVLGQNLCLKAELSPIDYCIYQISSPVVNTFSNCSTPFDNSILAVSGYCLNDVIKFEIKNSGESMSCFAPIRLFSDGKLDSKDSVQLMASETRVIEIPADGHTWRMEIDQHPDFIGLSQPNAAVERCGDINSWTPGLVGSRYLDDLDPAVDIFCTVVTGSYDPNDKAGYPQGVGAEHFVLPNQKMEYRIRFQNTGTDTAFTVVIRDTLDTDFDIFTVQSTVASHAYTFQLYGPRVLEWTFSDILLPDSTTNEAGSHGFVTFEVHQNPNLDNQTKLTNTAAIYFDFNEPILTNETEHIVNDGIQQIISTTTNTHHTNLNLFELFPNPTSGDLYIDLKKTYQDIQVDLYSILGQQIKHEESKLNDQLNIEMNVSTGVYFIIVSVDEGYNEVFRVVKE